MAAAQKTRKVMGKKVKRGDKEFQEIVDEMVVDLVLQDMEAAGEIARKKAEQEHEVRLCLCRHINFPSSTRSCRYCITHGLGICACPKALLPHNVPSAGCEILVCPCVFVSRRGNEGK